MHRFPLGWTLARFDQLMKRVEGRGFWIDDSQTYNCVGVRWYGFGAFVRESVLGLNINRKQQWLIREGDVVYNKLFAWKGAFAIADKGVDGCIVSDKFPLYTIDIDRVDPAYLGHFFRTPEIATQAEALSKGAAAISKLTLNPPQLWDLTIPLPPLDEQQRIVKRIERIKCLVGSLVEHRSRTVSEITSLRHRAVDGLFAEPEGRTVGDYVRIQSGYAFKSHWFSEEGVRLVRNVNVGHGVIDWGAVAKLPWNRAGEFERFVLSLGDIVISLDRPIISTGVKVARVRESDLPSFLLQRVGRVCFSTDELLPNYFYAWLQSGRFIRALDPGRSNGVPHISPKDIERIPFSVPPLAQQQKVVAEIRQLIQWLDTADRLQNEVSPEVEALMPSVLNHAFSGQL